MTALTLSTTPRPAEAAALERAAQLGYVTLASVKDCSAVLWRAHCRREGRPFVKVRRYRTRAEVGVRPHPFPTAVHAPRPATPGGLHE